MSTVVVPHLGQINFLLLEATFVVSSFLSRTREIYARKLCNNVNKILDAILECTIRNCEFSKFHRDEVELKERKILRKSLLEAGRRRESTQFHGRIRKWKNNENIAKE